MSTSQADSLHRLADFKGFLQGLQDIGVEYSVIGGQAVGAYAHRLGRESLSRDLDILAVSEAMERALLWAGRSGFLVRKRPQPRSIPVAFLEWEGREVNILTSSAALTDPAAVFDAARFFHVGDDLAVPVADPFDLLRDKLRVNREKDRPHIAILLDFVAEEAVQAFESETDPRLRLTPARKLLRVTGQRFLPAELARRLTERARTRADYRFLADVDEAFDPAITPSQWLDEVTEILRKR
ncbi:MAG: hypothetical protein AB1758_09755 [Candidatus Eremiobacterota bacterium]